MRSDAHGRTPTIPAPSSGASIALAAEILPRVAFAPVSRDTKKLAKKIDEHLAANAENKAFSLAYDIGNSFSGQTHFALHGDGTYSLWSTVTEGRARLELTGKLTSAEMRELLTALSRSHFSQGCADEKSKVEDDVVNARISIKDGRTEEVAGVWLSQMDDHPGFKAAQDTLLALIGKLSGGKILEKGQ